MKHHDEAPLLSRLHRCGTSTQFGRGFSGLAVRTDALQAIQSREEV